MTDETAVDAGALVAGRYRLKGLVGRGGMAAVHRATDEALGRDVALKLFRPHLADDDERRRQEAEIRVLAAFNHPRLVTLFDAGTDEEGSDVPRTFLVMELVDGTDLRRQIRGGALSEAEVRSIGADVAEALAYVHSKGVIHRDVKPANVLLSLDDGSGALRAKLADFGVARIVEGTRLTATGTTIGTASYLSPEQATGAVLTPASDVYSLGLVLLECLKGEVEYAGNAIAATVARLQRDPAVPENLEPGLAELLARMTRKDPAARPTAAEAAAALRQAAAGAATTALPVASAATRPLPALPQRPPRSATTGEQTRAPGAQPPFGVARRQPGGARLRPAGARAVSLFRRRLFWLAAAAVLLVVAVLVIVGLASRQPAVPAAPPSYPAVPGQLGEHLKDLQGSVTP
ncbi:serine/threonine-protein kinase [Paenarthrobacter sp. DKR-5]|uniref:serine/threonine-protein kinase n=1 Tax=Paenarthrobacter sp. DKR-5 TaxID=2835535 RepID=UPI0027DC1D60|nr:serine/threonine-protein kinase [Paenarthrobacter sp. DKR-5]